MRTPFTDLLGCRLPIQQAGFDALNVDLATAVSRVGGLGMLGAQLVNAETLAAALHDVRTMTSAPVAVNFASSLFDLERDLPTLDVAIGGSAMVELFFYGDPNIELVKRVHAGGCLASWQVGSVADGLRAVECGCDVLVVQGMEAGGHVRGETALLPLLSEVLAHVDIPVIAAGGISTPRALAAVLAAGAAAGRIGTALVASEEADFHTDYKRAIVRASGQDTVRGEYFPVMLPNAPHRVLRSASRAVDELKTPTAGEMELGGERHEVARGAGLAPGASATGRVDAMAMFAGEGVGSVSTIRPAADIVLGLWNGARDLIRAAALQARS
jgi:nitronate monooxygenase